MAQQIPQLFGLIPTGHPAILAPTSAPSQTSFLYTIPLDPAHLFSHIVAFLLPGTDLPPETAAAVYISLPTSPSPEPLQPNFKFLGGIGPGKESAIFKITGLSASPASTAAPNREVDMDSGYPEPLSSFGSSLTIGISIEPAASVAAQMAALQANNASQSQSLVPAKQQQNLDPLLLAQRIIKNEFNFLASFSGNVANGVEVVPLKAFEDWWRKFEGKVRADPGFLERDSQD
ncbi:Uncharacterized protein BP5553_10228 [Venustampulla echinocandica]|uniref:Uncharacterized protein n=1 Tax=Venustampulla echinocandica TaxID=2656787 RepID=A0A370T9L4_9HELO|nr:Uncharacterized protein BP5553_10228 [Venustampulla echinocandica]RDL30350.1 Uncharacterized protein BP5553_10228 [Venustampulla echinocandica]